MKSPAFTKVNVSTWLFWSLLPLGLWGFVSLIGWVVVAVPDSEANLTFWPVLWLLGIALGWPAWWLALIAGLVLRFLANHQEHRQQREGLAYAEMHGWQPISNTQWKSFKRRGVTLTVQRAHTSKDYLLHVELDGEIVGTSGFSMPYYALHFGDYLWANVLSTGQVVDAGGVQQHRQEWGHRGLPTPR